MPEQPSIVLWKEIHEITTLVCKYYGLTYGSLIPETRKTAYYGSCEPCARCHNTAHIDSLNCKEKILYIRVNQLNKPRVALAASTILNTLAHELAHLKYWGHGRKHREFEKEIINYMDELGYDVI